MPTTLFCVDFDETLFRTDRLKADLAKAIEAQFSPEVAEQYQAAYEATRGRGGISIPLVLAELRSQKSMPARDFTKLADLFHTFPYQQYVYEGAEAALMHLKTLGTVIILSDGDELFQTKKIYATSLAHMVDHVVVVPNKVEYFMQLQGFYPADTYVFIDDKARVLDSVHQYFGTKAKTVHVRQGQYASVDPAERPSRTIHSITEIDQSFTI